MSGLGAGARTTIAMAMATTALLFTDDSHKPRTADEGLLSEDESMPDKYLAYGMLHAVPCALREPYGNPTVLLRRLWLGASIDSVQRTRSAQMECIAS